MSLNGAQRAAVEHEGTPLIVLAGPGTGKTRVITERVRHLIERGAEPESVLALTFTNKAAGELRERLGASVGMGVAERVQASTFHALGLRLLQRFGDRAGLGPRVQIMDSSQRRRLMRELALAHGVYGDTPRGIEGELERAKGVFESLRHAGVLPDRARDWAASELTADLDEARRVEIELFARDVRLFELFDEAARREGLLTFDDLLARPAALIEHDPIAATLIRSDIRHIVVDEFQDVNTAQIEMLRALAPPNMNPDLVVVGDDDQSIYAFRGADDRAFARFAQTWERVETIALTHTYRSPEEVVRVASGVIGRAGARFAPDKTLEVAPDREGPAGSVEVVHLGSYDESGEVIAAQIRHEIAGEDEPDWRRFAVIARKRKELGRVRQALELNGIPLSAEEDADGPKDDGVDDLLAWVEMILDPHAAWAAQRLLTRPPISADPKLVLEWGRQYRAAKSRARAGEEQPGAFAPWLAAHAAGKPGADEAQRFAELLSMLAGVASHARADEAMGEIVRRTGLVHADLLSGRERAQRVRAVARVLRFVRERVDRIDQPRDLAAWQRYYDDLDDRDQAFTARVGEDALGEEREGSDAARPNVVMLLTAHGAKGLEFDTVFVSGVSPKTATRFPDSRAPDDPLPEGLIDRVGDERGAKERTLDEERRLFYVACTRAERRLVLLGEVPKKPSGVHFLCEFRGAAGVSWTTSAEVLEALAGDGGVSDEAQRAIDAVADRDAARAAVERARRAARLNAAAALARAGIAGDDPASEIAALADAARRMAIVHAAESDAEAPAWATDAGLGDFAEELAAVVREGRPAAEQGDGLDPLPGPLRMSYTGIAAYEWCPRCFYVEHALRLPRAPAAAQRFGRGMHEGLQAFYERWRVADSAGEALPGEAEMVAAVRDAVIASYPARDEIEPGTIERAEAQARLVWERLHDASANINELETRVRFPIEIDGVEHTIEAKLDRVDQVEGGDWRIVDYKTGRARKALTEPKELRKDLQMGIYALGLRRLYGDETLPGRCEYWFVGEGVRSAIGFDEIDLEGVLGRIEKAARGMLTGAFGRSKDCNRDGDDAACAILDRR
ncbi:MAG: ATP-dependent DNA helicase [Phycisphaerales bacterium]